MADSFSSYHPLVNFLYFALVLGGTMLLMHPAALCVSLSMAFVWSVYLGGRRVLLRNLAFALPMLLAMALINPAFNHEGGTLLTYLPSGNPLTLESILYGLAAAAMIVAVLLWFTCYNRVMTSDKFIYLFGRVIPALSLLLSMVLRFVPLFKARLKAISQAQRSIGRDVSTGSLLRRALHGIRILSILVTWSLENAIETADSMKSRGYGLPGRTAFSLYRLDGRDRSALLVLLALGGYLFAMCLAGGLYYRYFPTFRMVPWDFRSISGLTAYLALCATPLILDLWEDRTWKRLRCGI